MARLCDLVTLPIVKRAVIIDKWYRIVRVKITDKIIDGINGANLVTAILGTAGLRTNVL
ncbi:hypothetical protein DSM106972_064420 [Dulcicalothrix desertica PCC 7102]|uniref:Uncharacterized protein n=1 Tax=Dulcicalothrix desertica PCC 7102 TaxID=232991 RepID=A0A3S1C7P3_9CYAN|nr:hypothetical protein [Dulcicalothrix desertica]RUT01819.1 hypothetical protein DSM106972_064420 [Dulcicalothrix desertica PCC 7102]